MRNLLAVVGAIVAMLFLLASVGVGHFIFIYHGDKHVCTKATP